MSDTKKKVTPVRRSVSVTEMDKRIDGRLGAIETQVQKLITDTQRVDRLCPLHKTMEERWSKSTEETKTMTETMEDVRNNLSQATAISQRLIDRFDQLERSLTEKLKETNDKLNDTIETTNSHKVVLEDVKASLEEMKNISYTDPKGYTHKQKLSEVIQELKDSHNMGLLVKSAGGFAQNLRNIISLIVTIVLVFYFIMQYKDQKTFNQSQQNVTKSQIEVQKETIELLKSLK